MFLQKKHILVIDDTASIRTFLRISLQAKQAKIFEAATAKEGITLCKSVSPDLVVLDLGLPDKDGLEVLREIRMHPKETNDPIIIILSVRREQSTIDKAYDLGADAYITKPFMMDDLLEVIQEKIEQLNQ